MAIYNVHTHKLNVNVVPKYTEEYVDVINGVGETLIPEFYEQGTATFEGTTEDITISNKGFIISNEEYSGAVVVKYYAKDLCRLFLFSLIASGVTQVQTFLSRIYIKIYGEALIESLKNVSSILYIKEKSNKWNEGSIKNSLASIFLKFNLNGRIGSIKKLASSIKLNLLLSDAISVTKTMSPYFRVYVSGEADITVAKYRPLTDFTSNTLDDLLANVLENMIYTEV